MTASGALRFDEIAWGRECSFEAMGYEATVFQSVRREWRRLPYKLQGCSRKSAISVGANYAVSFGPGFPANRRDGGELEDEWKFCAP